MLRCRRQGEATTKYFGRIHNGHEGLRIDAAYHIFYLRYFGEFDDGVDNLFFSAGISPFAVKEGNAAPYMMKGLSVIGTAAMFLVGGGNLTHGIPAAHEPIHHLAEAAGAAGWLVPTLVNGVVGIVAGALVLAVVSLAKKLFGKV